MQQAPCPGCGSPVEFEPVYRLANQTWTPYCADCLAKEDRERQNRIAGEFRARQWLKLCPHRFQDTVFERLPCPDKSTRAMAWKFGGGRGLNLWGHPSTGKTRTMFLILQALHARGQSMVVFSPTDFSAGLERRGFHRSSWASNLSRFDIIGFDDMDKLALTRPQELVFFGLLDKRMAAKRPCIFTHNSNAQELTYRFKSGEALIRRIREFTQSIHFP